MFRREGSISCAVMASIPLVGEETGRIVQRSAPANWYGRKSAADPAPSDTPKHREVDALCRRRAWARLLANVHSIDVLACPRCASRMSVFAVILDPAQIRTIIAYLDRHGRGPPPLG